MKDLVKAITENSEVLQGVASTAVNTIAGISLTNLFEEYKQRHEQGKIKRDFANDSSARSAFTKIFNAINQDKLEDQEILRAAKDLYFEMLGEDQADIQKDRIRLQAIDLLLNQGLNAFDVEVFLKFYQLRQRSFKAKSALQPRNDSVSKQWNDSEEKICLTIAQELNNFLQPVSNSYKKLCALKLFISMNQRSLRSYGFANNILGDMDENGFPVNCDFRLNDYGVAIAEVILNSKKE